MKIGNYAFYQKKDENYNGLFRLLSDFNQTHKKKISFIKKSFFIIQGDICAIADEDKLFGKYNLSRIPIKNIIIDMSTEAININLGNQFYINNLQKLSTILRQPNYQHFQFYLIHANTTKHSFDTLLRQHGIIYNNLKFVSLDFYLGRFFLDINFTSEFFYDKNQLEKEKTRLLNQSEYLRHYICLNHRPRWHRYAVVTSLIASGHLDKGHVSFAGENEGRIDAPTVDSIDYAKSIIRNLDNAKNMLNSIDKLTNMTPLIIDKNPLQIQNELWGKAGTGHLGQPLGIDKSNSQVNKKFRDCYFEIVTETYFTDDKCDYITEKILRPIISLRPFICVGTPFLLKKLRNYGFKTFTPYIDESYDEIIDPIQRMNTILKEINRLCSLSKAQIHTLYLSLWDTLEYNHLHFHEKLNGYFHRIALNNLLSFM